MTSFEGRTEQMPTFCALCISRCGAIATLEDGRLTALAPDPTHPTGQALCLKGKAAPELVYHRRPAPPSDEADPAEGRRRSRLGADNWDEALDTVAARLRRPGRGARAGDGRFHQRLPLDLGARRLRRLAQALQAGLRQPESRDLDGGLRLGAMARQHLHLRYGPARRRYAGPRERWLHSVLGLQPLCLAHRPCHRSRIGGQGGAPS